MPGSKVDVEMSQPEMQGIAVDSSFKEEVKDDTSSVSPQAQNKSGRKASGSHQAFPMQSQRQKRAQVAREASAKYAMQDRLKAMQLSSQKSQQV